MTKRTRPIEAARRAAGLCPDCGEPPVPGRVRCEFHMARGRANTRRHYEKDPELHRQRAKEYAAAHPAETAERNRRWREEHPDRVRELEATSRARLRERNPHHMRDYARQVRREAIDAYGGACECCGETTFEFLAIDHINNDGSAERRRLKGTHAILLRLRRASWPRGSHRILCHNCNMARAFYGECPHTQFPKLKVVVS